MAQRYPLGVLDLLMGTIGRSSLTSEGGGKGMIQLYTGNTFLTWFFWKQLMNVIMSIL